MNNKDTRLIWEAFKPAKGSALDGMLDPEDLGLDDDLEPLRKATWEDRSGIKHRVIDSDYITHDNGIFYVDREDLETGEEIASNGDRIVFDYEGNTFTGSVDQPMGRNDDIFQVHDLSKTSHAPGLPVVDGGEDEEEGWSFWKSKKTDDET